jgi:AraC family transcriptional regulator
VSKKIEREFKKRESSSTGVVPDEAARLEPVFAYVRENLDADLSVRRLAELTGLSASCFSRWFRRHVGITPHAYVIRTRVERAMDLIRDGNSSLAEIALKVGFSSQACLTVAFRRHAGVTPGQFRVRSRKAKDR